MVACGCTVLDSDSPCLAAQGWDSIDPTLLRTQPEKVAHVFGIGSELRVLLLELELPQLFSSHVLFCCFNLPGCLRDVSCGHSSIAKPGLFFVPDLPGLLAMRDKLINLIGVYIPMRKDFLVKVG